MASRAVGQFVLNGQPILTDDRRDSAGSCDITSHLALAQRSGGRSQPPSPATAAGGITGEVRLEIRRG